MEPALDWTCIDDVLLDLDGTVLDLSFDNHFWNDVVPAAYAKRHRLDLADAQRTLAPRFAAMRGQLPWYCVEHWSRETGLDLMALKRRHAQGIRTVPGAGDFIDAVRASGRRLWLVTNAHPQVLSLKLECTGLAPRFDTIVSTHPFGYPKEDAAFWQALEARHPFDPTRTLFVDDNLDVLAVARRHGIAQVVAIRWPDSSRVRSDSETWMGVDRLGDLAPGVPSTV